MKKPSSDRKLVLLITSIFFVLDICLLTWDYSFDEKMHIYKRSLVLRLFLKFAILMYFRKTRSWWWNLLYAIPYLGLWSALFYFFFGKKHTKNP